MRHSRTPAAASTRPAGHRPLHAWATRPGGLSTTLSAELATLRHTGRSDEVLEVLASCLRLQADARLLLQWRGQVRSLSVYPRLGRCLLPRALQPRRTTSAAMPDLAVIAVESADPPPSAGLRPLPPLLWQLAWQAPGPRLLAVLRGELAFRLAPGLPASEWFPPALQDATRQLQQAAAPLESMARWPGMDRAQAIRLLNGAYLQGHLMRLQHHPSHPLSLLRRLL
jgi:hypothetical protein